MRKYKPWQCPTCQNHASLGDEDVFRKEDKITNYARADLSFIFTTIVCPNPNCQKIEAHIAINEKLPPELPRPPLSQIGQPRQFRTKATKAKKYKPISYRWQLLPKSAAKIFPEYVPLSIRADYEEACLIKDLSPKASATLARRCMQTIIRDFWGIKNKNRLCDEIDALLNNPNVDQKFIGVFHGLRKIGNIGAHMEKDTNLIVDVDSEEADTLIAFIEDLIKLTYISRYENERNMESTVRISATKEAKKLSFAKDDCNRTCPTP